MRNTVRGKRVREDRDTIVECLSGAFPHRAGDNPAIGFIEGVQFIAGTAELAPLQAVAPKAKLDLFGLSSYYGPRTASQFPRLIHELRNNVGTRRAVLMVAHPEDSPETVPCTVSIQFQRAQASSQTLYCTVSMRSSDLVWGLPYDIIQFSLVANAVACCCGMSDYDLAIQSGNAHVYETTAVHPSLWSRMYFAIPVRFGQWEEWVEWARHIVYRDPLLTRGEVLNAFSVQDSTKKGGDETQK